MEKRYNAISVTQPFGATFGDLLTKPIAKGGLDLGTLNASVVCLFLTIALWVMRWVGIPARVREAPNKG